MPVAFAMFVASIGYLFVTGRDIGLFGEQILNGLYDSFVLLAVPLFILAANIMNASGVSDRLFEFCQALVGPISRRPGAGRYSRQHHLLGDVRIGDRGRGRARQARHADDDQAGPYSAGICRLGGGLVGDHRARSFRHPFRW